MDFFGIKKNEIYYLKEEDTKKSITTKNSLAINPYLLSINLFRILKRDKNKEIPLHRMEMNLKNDS